MSQNVARRMGAGIAGLIAAAFRPALGGRKHPLRETTPCLPHGTHVDAWRWQNRSKYTPHQGHRECQRRRARGFHRLRREVI